MSTDAHSPYEDDLAAYLLGALPADEVAALESHLEGCERCRGRERWLRSAVDLLPSSVEQRQPPPELRERLMATVRAEVESEDAAARPEHARRAATRPPLWERLSLGLRPATAGLAAAFIIAAGTAGFLIGSNGDGGGGTTDTTVIQARTTPAGPDVRASLERRGDSGTLAVERLSPRKDSIYQVWIARAGKDPESAGVFDVSESGRGAAQIESGLDSADEVLVTPEPPGGSAQPTSDPVLRVRV